MATGSAASAHAGIDVIMNPTIQPIVTSLTDFVSAFVPVMAADLTAWTDTFLTHLDAASAVPEYRTATTSFANVGWIRRVPIRVL